MTSNPTQMSSVLGRCRTGFVAVASMSLVVNLLMLTVPVFMMQVFDRVLTGRSGATLIYLAIMAAVALGVMAALDLLRSRILVRLGTWLDHMLSPSVFGRSLENAARGFAYRGEALRDLGTLRSYLGGAGIMALFDAPWMPVYLIVVYLLHPVLGHISLIGAVGLFVLAVVNHRATAPLLEQANKASGYGLRRAESAYRNIEVIDGMGMASAFIHRWDRVNADVLSLQGIASDRAGLVSSLTKFFRLFLQLSILGAGAWLVLLQQLSPGGMIAASIIMSRALAPVEQAIGTWRHTIAAREAWSRLDALFRQRRHHPAAMPLPRPQGHLTVEGVTFTPRGARRPVLKKVSLAVKPGEALAIIGPSAAGKSTLVRLIVGLAQPESGAVRLDGADVFAWNREDFGRFVGYLPQDVELFPGTVAENISRMHVGDPEKVVEAARLAGVHDMILSLPDGYETQIGEQGSMLSGGQRQRIGLARALYGEPVLLVLDEPDSSLDAPGEQALNAAIEKVKASGTTVVLIAHRPSMLAHVDRVAVLNNGTLEIFGQRNEVLGQMQRLAAPRSGPPVRVVT